MGLRPRCGGPRSAPLSRNELLLILEAYGRRHPGEAATVLRIRGLVEDHPDCLDRRCLPGHLTASAWIFDSRGHAFLLTHHRKLGRWLQIGGHADGDPCLARVAAREAEEEAGLACLELLDSGLPGGVLDLDVHPIPARGAEPAHEHHDFRFAFVAPPGARLRRAAAESKELRWFPRAEWPAILSEPGLRRLASKADRLARTRFGDSDPPAPHQKARGQGSPRRSRE